MAQDYPWISPVIFDLGFLQLRWYSVAYVLGFVFALFYSGGMLVKFKVFKSFKTSELLYNYVIIGVLIGGRAFYVLAYNFGYYRNNPLEVLKVWQGGMSFHGALLGAALAFVWFGRKYNFDFYQLSDFTMLSLPFGLFFGRVANFINGELWGRVTDVFWAVSFPASGTLDPRHPSQLYEALIEGLVPFFVLLFLSRRTSLLKLRRCATFLMCSWYAIGRFGAEFFREPDSQIGLFFGVLSMGQILCALMLICIAGLCYVKGDFRLWFGKIQSYRRGVCRGG